MPFVPFSNVVKAELIYRQDGQVIENVLHYLALVTPSIVAMEGLAVDLATRWNANMKPIVSSSVSLNTIRITSLVTDSAPVVEYAGGMPSSGTATGTALPNNVTVAVKWLTLSRGRSYRGRTFQVGLTSNQVTGNTLVPAYRTSLATAWAAFIDIGTESDWRLVVASRVSGGVPREIGEATLVEGLTINPTLDSQRRRLPERGL